MKQNLPLPLATNGHTASRRVGLSPGRILTASALSLGLAPFGVLSADPTQEEKPPNVLFIAVDDLRPELGIYGSRAKTPNIDRLAKSGVQFNRAYCNQAVCGASRVSVMTGLYPEFTKERTFHVESWRERLPDVTTLNQFFKEKGYQTVGLGKIYHRWSGPDVDLANWTEYLESGGQQYVNPSTLEQGKAQAAAFGKPFNRGPATEAGEVENAEDEYVDGARVIQATQQLKKLAESEQPFFFAVGFSKPHLPFNAPVAFWDLYDRESFSMPENSAIPPGYPEDAANPRAGELRSYSDIPPASDGREVPNPKEFPEELNKRLMHGYHASVSFTDRNIGKLMEALEASGKADNTIVVLWADHGYKLGDHSTWTKHTNFEIDTRVPLVIVHPGMKNAKGTSDALVELIDLYPTLAELCGLEPPPHLQGKSLKPVLEDPTSEFRDYAYSSYPVREDDNIIGHSIRNEQYRYTEWWNAKTGDVVARVATDLVADPGETTNVLPDNPELGRKMSQDLKDIVTRARSLPQGQAAGQTQTQPAEASHE